MSLITRCPACMTMFKVVPDQLRISDGWVRCGQCAEIFDATQQLVTPAGAPVDIPLEAVAPEVASADPVPPADRGPAITSEVVPPPPEHFADTPMVSDAGVAPAPYHHDVSSDRVAAEETDGREYAIEAAPASQALQEAPPEAVAAAAAEPFGPGADLDATSDATPDAVVDLSVTRADTDIVATPPASALEVVPSETWAAPADDPPEAEAEPKPEPELEPAAVPEPPATARAGFATLTLPADPIQVPPAEPATGDVPAVLPSFMQQAQAADSVWLRPALRTTLRVMAPLLCLALALQAARHERDRIVALAPDTRPAFELLCQWTRCALSPLRRIEAIVVDGSSFGRVHDNLYRLSIGIRNTASLPVLLPAVELSLTNSQAQTLVRRVIDASEFNAAPEALAPGGEWNGALLLRIDNAPAVQDIAGYGLFAFYP